MNSLAVAQPKTGAYLVEFASPASLALLRTPAEVAAEIRRRLQEIAEVAGHAGGLGFVVLDGLGSTLRLEIAGHVVSYVVSDPWRVLTVLSVVPATGQ